MRLEFERIFVFESNAMMKLETGNRRDWQGFSRILEVISFVDEAAGLTREESREMVERLCQLPPSPGETMSMEEVVFWAGVAAGMELSLRVEEGTVDAESAEKVLIYSSLFEHSTKTAIVDLALRNMELSEFKNPGGR